ncbi:DUF6261 family protein [Prolixibacteraceae bacterium Z1-6]|uniref:DUF6261 family protein n=1 Tax=Draconibacterium aestuarii TaxID=2998507 RepID=A0A9X3J7V7_9BACT|nr:DUF6261 family protein [Prolixibacteraceae bacterium Z1-6]
MMEKIIVTSKATEIHGTSRLLSNAFQHSGLSTDATLAPLFTTLDTATTRLSEAIDRSKAQSILAGKDSDRDYTVRAVGYLVKGYTYYPDNEVRNAAFLVEQVFEKYGFAVTEESYVNESSHIVSMLGDFAAPKIQAAIALLPGVAENIALEQAAQNDFENTQTEYAKELAEENTLLNATTLKKEVATLINDELVVFLRYSERFQAAIYGTFAATVAKIITDNNIQVKKRWKKETQEE